MKKQRFRRTGTGVATFPRLRPTFDDFHLLSMDGDYEYPCHRHTNYEIILVENGPYACELNGVELTLSDGQVLMVKPGDWHADHLKFGQRHYVLHFRLVDATGAQPPPIFESSVEPLKQVSRGDFGHDAWLVEELRREAELGLSYGAAVQDSLLEALFWRVTRGLPIASLSAELRRLPQDEQLRERIVTAMQCRLGENLTVKELANELSMSPRHLASLSQRLCGESPARLFLRLKLERADDLLRFRGLMVKQVSDELGFANPYHFSRVYHRYFDHPPSRRESGQ